ncbi:HK97 gp10 family phage protein [Cytobacillus sp. IB215665]|uniref:HK97 gp10 family phage protein n=1 Tax=Cytobacillus sp. IB215665 TaxID=3097357 RepID=UPI002A157EDF|nr:HK97 gp10 family phage protein [Cytobacillus sp. IB215665]MDX8367856.1 HK97 gp10 family phage protein [Cytobacillus sp. IB215665]
MGFKKTVHRTAEEEIQRLMQKREQAVEQGVIIIEADAKLNCPVDTGALKRSITHSVESNKNKTTGKVGSNVEYAYWAEQKKPYLEPAVDQNVESVKRMFKEVLNSD